MKSTQVDREGNVRCPKCGATDFSDKRTGRAKVGGLLTLGVGVVAMPKRLKCRGCGENLKRGGDPWKGDPKPEREIHPNSIRAHLDARKEARDESQW